MLYEDSYLMSNCIIAENRKKRPNIDKEEETCPFCPGHEQALETVIMNVKAWEKCFLVRIVNNKFPICGDSLELHGEHDVVIDTPFHLQHPKDFSEAHWLIILQTMQKRWHQLSENPNIQFIQIFKNYGIEAGASILHSHWQIVALEQIPFQVRLRYQYFNAFEKENHRCYHCNLLAELQDETVIAENSDWVVIAPQVSEFSHETWLIPKTHRKHFGLLNEMELHSCSLLMKKLLIAYEALKQECAFNVCFMGGAIRDKENYHFYIKIIPRLSQLAGFELSTGCYINTVHPKTHVQIMKKLLREQEA